MLFSLKKVSKIFLKVLLAFLALILVLWILLQTSFFQNFIITRVTKSLSKKLNTTVSIKHVDFELFDKMSLQGMLVLDHHKDTLLYAGAAKVSITDWFFFKNNITLKYIGLDDAIINLNRTDSVWNYQFLVDYFSSSKKGPDTSKDEVNVDLKVLNLNRIKIWKKDEWRGENMLLSVNKLNLQADLFDNENKIIKINAITLDQPDFSLFDYAGKRPTDTSTAIKNNLPEPSGLQWNTDGWHISIKNISLKNGALAIESESNSPAVANEFDDKRIVLSELNGTFKNFEFIKDTLKANVNISAKDRGGFVLKKLSADYKFTPKIMEFKNLDLVTNKSHLRNYYSMRYNSFNDDMQDFVHAVTLEGHFENSEVSSDDIAYFASDAKSWNTLFSLSGNAKGEVDNLTTQKMLIQEGGNNYLDGDIILKGLPDINQTFIDFRSRDLRTNYNELARLVPAIRQITNPDLSAFGKIKFTGSFTGYIRDFVTYGSLSTDIGTLQTDLHMQFPLEGKAIYDGKVSTNNFQLGKFIDNNGIGNIAFDGKINGKGFDNNDLDLGIDGTISKINFNNYTYTNIIAHGSIKKKLFAGSASINDENIKIDTLVGDINFSRKDPEFNLQALVSRLNLKNLGFTRDTVSLTGKFNLDFTGNNIDNFLGSAQLHNATLFDGQKHLSFDSLDINSSFIDGKKLLTVQTNELEASINGNFKILELPVAFQLFLNKYYPVYINKPTTKIENQDFTFLVKTKSVSDYINLFDKKIKGFDNSTIIGNINIASNTLNLQADVPQFNYNDISFNNVHLVGRGTEDTLTINTGIDDVVINDSLHSPGTKIKIVAANDISDITIKATANRTLNDASFSARVQTKKAGFKLTFNPSTFTINQKQWYIEKNGELELDNNKLMASDINLSQNGQKISISTKPSGIDSSNDLILALQNLAVEDFTPLFMTTPKVNGSLSGNISIHDPFGKPAIVFDTKLDKFKFEDDSIGSISATGKYLTDPASLTVNAISNNALYNFNANFGYYPSDTTGNQLTGSVVFNNTDIQVLEKYLDNIFSSITGRATGKLSISGKLSDPKLIGTVQLDSTSVTVDYTRCRYLINDNSLITFNTDEIDFGTIKIKDTLNNTATLTGKIYHSFFDNFFFNELHLKTDAIGNKPAKFILLNTTELDNKDFYGSVIGQAELSLNGFVTDLTMNISGEPTDSSHIYLPTGETAETGTLDYIEFTKFGHEMKPELKTNKNANIKVDMELTANPFAKIDVILDETTGDVIKAQGSGKLNINVGTKDPLTIRGRYDVLQGAYTFNLQTFFKTPFTLQQGYIEWQGDPYLAILNLDAIYKAQNVNLSNIPTSAGFTNTQGDVDIIFKLRGTLKDPRPEFEFQFPFDNPLKSDPIANEYLKTRFQDDQNELNKQVTSLLLFNTFVSSDQGLLTSNSTGSFVSRTVGQLLSSTLSSSLNTWLQKLFNTNSVNLYTNINTADFAFEKGLTTPNEVQNVGDFGFRTTFLNKKLLVKVGGNVNYRLGQAVSNSNFLLTPDVSFEYLITPDGRLRVIGFNRSDADLGDILGVTLRNRTGIQLSYRKDFNSFTEFFTNEKKKKNPLIPKKEIKDTNATSGK